MELKPCPFCGRQPDLVEHHVPVGGDGTVVLDPPCWTTECSVCEIGSVYRCSRESAVAMWNARRHAAVEQEVLWRGWVAISEDGWPDLNDNKNDAEQVATDYTESTLKDCAVVEAILVRASATVAPADATVNYVHVLPCPSCGKGFPGALHDRACPIGRQHLRELLTNYGHDADAVFAVLDVAPPDEWQEGELQGPRTELHEEIHGLEWAHRAAQAIAAGVTGCRLDIGWLETAILEYARPWMAGAYQRLDALAEANEAVIAQNERLRAAPQPSGEDRTEVQRWFDEAWARAEKVAEEPTRSKRDVAESFFLAGVARGQMVMEQPSGEGFDEWDEGNPPCMYVTQEVSRPGDNWLSLIIRCERRLAYAAGRVEIEAVKAQLDQVSAQLTLERESARKGKR